MSAYLKGFVLAVFVLLVSSLSFLAGYGAGQRPAVAATGSPQATATAGVAGELRLLWEAWDWVDREYYDRGAVEPARMTHGAIRGMLQSLGDPYTYFLDPNQRMLQETQLRGGFEGIGVRVEVKEGGKLTVVAPLAGSPGERAGIRPGDTITHVDGKSVVGLNLVEAVSLIRGPRGTGVTLTILREGLPDPLVLEVTRSEIRVESVQARMLEQNVAYVRITDFGAQTNEELRRALQTLLASPPAGLILDLRSNPGGYLVAAVDVASQFLSDGVVLYEEHKSGERQEFRVKPGGLATSIDMVVLVDGGSASASEIVAGAIQDHQRALLLGEKTLGKGSMQSVHQLSDGSSVQITIAHWLTPNGRPINGEGLAPDVTVSVPPDSPPGDDPQLEKAVEMIARSLL